MHAEEPSEVVYWPVEHATQAVAVVPRWNWPGAHAVQVVVAVAFWKRPISHSVHTVPAKPS